MSSSRPWATCCGSASSRRRLPPQRRDDVVSSTVPRSSASSAIAGAVLPETAALAGELMDENSDLRQRADRLERDLSTVAQALIAEEFPELDDTTHND